MEQYQYAYITYKTLHHQGVGDVTICSRSNQLKSLHKAIVFWLSATIYFNSMMACGDSSETYPAVLTATVAGSRILPLTLCMPLGPETSAIS